jgi:hypothetical protein
VETRPDILILGGGVAGLWTCARMVAMGFDVLCLDTGPLGGTQSIGAQGIIHGGMKYALTGEASRAANSIALMPPIWTACLAGTGELDLSGVPVCSDHTLLWTTPGLFSRIAAFAAKNVLRTPVDAVPAGQRPVPFAGVPRIDVYRVGEPVLDVAAVLQRLLTLCRGRVWRVRPESLRIERVAGGCSVTVSPPGNPGVQLHFTPRLTITLAGPGNQQVATAVGARGIRMQIRPLHMVMVRSHAGASAAEQLPTIYGHCLAASNLPRLTITTSTDAQGRQVWYLGGQIAEAGVPRSPEDQIAAAKKEVDACLPWLNIGGRADLQWSTVRWDRAEGFMPDGARPDEPVLLTDAACPGVLFGWPTKLAFAPRVAELAIAAAAAAQIAPPAATATSRPTLTLPPEFTALAAPTVADAAWNDNAAAWR